MTTAQRISCPGGCAWLALLLAGLSAAAPPPVSPLAPAVRRPVLALQVGHASAISTLAFSPDTRKLLSGSNDGTAKLWEVPSGRLLATLQGHTAPMGAVFSSDGAMIWTASVDRTVRRWDAVTGKQFERLDVPFGIRNFAVSPDGNRMVVGGLLSGIQLWDLPRRTVLMNSGAHSAHGVDQVLFSPDSATLATVGQEIHLWDAATGKRRATLPMRALGWAGRTVAFSPDGRLLATVGHPDGQTRLWLAATGELSATLASGIPADSAEPRPWFAPDGVLMISFLASPSGYRLQSWAQSATEQGWRRTSEFALPELPLAGVFSPDGKTFAFGGHWSTSLAGPYRAYVFNLADGRVSAVLNGHVWGVAALAFSRDGRLLATADNDAAVRIWNPATGGAGAVMRPSGGWVATIVASPDGRRLISRGVDGVLRLWDARNGQIVATMHSEAETVPGWLGSQGVILDRIGYGEKVDSLLAFSQDSATLAMHPPVKRSDAGSSSITAIEVRDGRTGSLQALIPAVVGEVKAIQFSPDGKLLALAMEVPRNPDSAPLWEGGVRIWELGRLRPDGTRTCREKFTFRTESGWLTRMAFSRDGSLFAATGQGVGVWDLRSGKPSWSIPGSDHDALLFSPDGTVLAASSGAAVRIYDSRSGEVRVLLHGHHNPVRALAFAPNGELIATGSVDQTARLWDARTGNLKRVLEGHNVSVRSAEFSADGRSLSTVDDDGLVLRWDTATGAPLSPAKGRLVSPGIALGATTAAGPGLVVRDDKSGAERVTLFPITTALAAAPGGKPIDIEARPIDIDARPIGRAWDEWFAATTEGYFDCSIHAAGFVQWNVNGELYPAERFLKRFRRPDLVRMALRGERIDAPGMSLQAPPTARLVGLADGAPVAGPRQRLTVEVRAARPAAAVELLVNGRPPAPAEARPVRIEKLPAARGDARRPYTSRFTYDLTLPGVGEEIRLRAVAADEQQLSSAPAEVTLRRARPRATSGRLLVLAIGVGRYRSPGIRPLRFAPADAQAIAQRLRNAGPSLYAEVRVKTLSEQQATLANVRAGLGWLQAGARAGGQDTVVVYLSGHGTSSAEGHYAFAPYDFDGAHPAQTSLTASELKEALGGKLRAGKVFLLVDTCHAGALSCRNDDLAIEVGSGVYLLASAGVGDSAYESPEWQHGAFTLALLRALGSEGDLTAGKGATRNAVTFAELATGVQRELAALLKAAGRSETEQSPCVFFAGLDAAVPVAAATRPH